MKSSHKNMKILILHWPLSSFVPVKIITLIFLAFIFFIMQIAKHLG